MPEQQIQIFTTQDGQVRLEVQLEQETLWLTQAQIAELFQVKPQNITMHLKKVYLEGELGEAATCKDFLQVQEEGARRVKRTLKALQPGCHYFSGLSDKFQSCHAVQNMGDRRN